MKVTIEDIVEYKKNAVKTLESNSQYATAKVAEMAFDALIYAEQNKWAVSANLCQKEGVYLSKDEYENLLEYKFMYENLCV